MFFVILLVAFIIIILLIAQLNRSKHKRLIVTTVVMIMVGVTCRGYYEIIFSYSYTNNINKGIFSTLVNQSYIFTIGSVLLVISIPCTLFCLLSKPKKISELDKPLEENDDLYG